MAVLYFSSLSRIFASCLLLDLVAWNRHECIEEWCEILLDEVQVPACVMSCYTESQTVCVCVCVCVRARSFNGMCHIQPSDRVYMYKFLSKGFQVGWKRFLTSLWRSGTLERRRSVPLYGFENFKSRNESYRESVWLLGFEIFTSREGDRWRKHKSSGRGGFSRRTQHYLFQENHRTNFSEVAPSEEIESSQSDSYSGKEKIDLFLRFFVSLPWTFSWVSIEVNHSW